MNMDASVFLFYFSLLEPQHLLDYIKRRHNCVLLGIICTLYTWQFLSCQGSYVNCTQDSYSPAKDHMYTVRRPVPPLPRIICTLYTGQFLSCQRSCVHCTQGSSSPAKDHMYTVYRAIPLLPRIIWTLYTGQFPSCLRKQMLLSTAGLRPPPRTCQGQVGYEDLLTTDAFTFTFPSSSPPWSL